MAGYSTIVFDKRDDIAWVTLNRPEQLNAYNMKMRDELHQAFSAIYDDTEVRAMVLAGAGPAFSTGGDVSEFGMAPSPIVARWVRFRRDVWGLLRRMPIPTIAAVHGYTVGGGLEMMLLCDFAVAGEDARFSLPETGLGMIPGVAGTQTLPRRGGLAHALDLCITGRWIDAAEALRVGLVGEVVPTQMLDRAAETMARRVSRLPKTIIALAKFAVWEGLDMSLPSALDLERRLAVRLNPASALAHPNDPGLWRSPG